MDEQPITGGYTMRHQDFVLTGGKKTKHVAYERSNDCTVVLQTAEPTPLADNIFAPSLSLNAQFRHRTISY